MRGGWQAKIRVLWPQAQDYLELPEALRSREVISPRAI